MIGWPDFEIGLWSFKLLQITSKYMDTGTYLRPHDIRVFFLSHFYWTRGRSFALPGLVTNWLTSVQSTLLMWLWLMIALAIAEWKLTAWQQNFHSLVTGWECMVKARRQFVYSFCSCFGQYFSKRSHILGLLCLWHYFQLYIIALDWNWLSVFLVLFGENQIQRGANRHMVPKVCHQIHYRPSLSRATGSRYWSLLDLFSQVLCHSTATFFFSWESTWIISCTDIFLENA